MSNQPVLCAHAWTAPTITNKRDTVTVKVGTGRHIRKYNLHVEALRARSGYFHEALPASTNEDCSTVRLPLSATKSFDIFTNWLYSGNLGSNTDVGSRYLFLCELHAFADKFDIPLLRNKIVDVFFKKLLHDTHPLPYDIMKYVEEHLRDSALRTMMQDIMLKCGEVEEMTEWKVNLAKGFGLAGGGKQDLVEPFCGSADVREYLVGLQGQVCEKYHEHAERDEMVVKCEELWFFDPPLQ
jgi:hypothetical protein